MLASASPVTCLVLRFSVGTEPRGWGNAVSYRIRNSERGGAKAKGLLALVVLIALVFGIVKIVPIYVNNYDLQDAMQQEARFAFNPNTGLAKNSDEVRADIVKKVQTLGIPLQPDDIHVTDVAGKVTISAEYTITVDLIIYQLPLHFHPRADNVSI